MNPLRIGTRSSALAQWQAESVRKQLAEKGVAAELVLVRTTGDRDPHAPLRTMAGKGVFIKELEDALLEERIDLAVHSMKDVPTELPEGLLISAVTKREDVRDALVSREGLSLDRLPHGARVGTGSLRRQAQLRHYRVDLQMADIRGNVDTRLAKLDRGDYDAIVLAQAGLERLGMAGRVSETLSPTFVFRPRARAPLASNPAGRMPPFSRCSPSLTISPRASRSMPSALCWPDWVVVVSFRLGFGRTSRPLTSSLMRAFSPQTAANRCASGAVDRHIGGRNWRVWPLAHCSIAAPHASWKS